MKNIMSSKEIKKRENKSSPYHKQHFLQQQKYFFGFCSWACFKASKGLLNLPISVLKEIVDRYSQSLVCMVCLKSLEISLSK